MIYKMEQKEICYEKETAILYATENEDKENWTFQEL